MITSPIPTFEQTFEPFAAFSKLATEAAEKAYKMQLDCSKIYAKVGMDNISEGLKVSNFDQMTSYAEKQKDVYKKTNDMMIADAKSYADIGVSFFDSARLLIEDTAKSNMTAVKEATKVATKAVTPAK
jgi:phasin family protein